MTPDTLRGNPRDLMRLRDIPRCGLRTDGTRRGRGYYGRLCLKTAQDEWAIELPAAPCPETHHQSYPLLVPGLSRAEITHLVTGGTPTDHIKAVAQQHARMRIAHGQPPFAQSGERVNLPPFIKEDPSCR